MLGYVKHKLFKLVVTSPNVPQFVVILILVIKSMSLEIKHRYRISISHLKASSIVTNCLLIVLIFGVMKR